jgi:hypothetical protein
MSGRLYKTLTSPVAAVKPINPKVSFPDTLSFNSRQGTDRHCVENSGRTPFVLPKESGSCGNSLEKINALLVKNQLLKAEFLLPRKL